MKTSQPTTKWEALQQQVLGWVVWPALALARLAYRLLGKRCTYRPGQVELTPLEPLSRAELLFVRLFPSGLVVGAILLVMAAGYALGLSLS
jgi:hypothetical protein